MTRNVNTLTDRAKNEVEQIIIRAKLWIIVQPSSAQMK